MSLGDAPIVAFAPTTDLDRAREFYVGVLGLTLEETNPFACVVRGGGTMLRITKVDSFTPHPFTVLGWGVEDLDATMASLRAAGVTFNRYEGMGQDDAGVWTAPSGARIAWFPDPDGNVLSLSQI
jgi:catechol 2,3-dioxygenase-like lactoylglutathione lyase family enzyme